jgi:hypothetical protein
VDIEGGGNVHVYAAQDEVAHRAGPQQHWQESVVLIWWDQQHNIGGFHRIGHEPNHDGGKVALWHNLFTPQGVFRRNHFLPLRRDDHLTNGFGGGIDGYRFEYDSHCRWTLNDQEASATLQLEDFHPSMDGYTKTGSFGNDFAPHHLEVACRVRGSVTVGSNTTQIEGMGMRDHGWGPRHWQAMLSHRWAAAVFGPDLSVVVVTFQGMDDRLVKFGWVVREQRVIYARDIDVLSFIDIDGVTNRGGEVRLTLTTGEVAALRFDPVAPCVMTWHHGMACMDTLCRVTWGERVGYGDFETSSNTLKGERRPVVLAGGMSVDHGWFPATSR